MAYVDAAHTAEGTALSIDARQEAARHRRAHAFPTHPLLPQGSRQMTRYFTKEHEWIQVDGDTATVGITDFAQARWATSPSSNCPKRAAPSRRAKLSPWWNR
jgi:hypothetical protein